MRRLTVFLLLLSLATWTSLCAQGQMTQEERSVQFGVGTYLALQGYGGLWQSAKPKEIDRTNYLNAVSDLAAVTIREGVLSWGEIEPERGKGYRFEDMDDLVQKASDRGINILGIAWYFPAWATSDMTGPFVGDFTADDPRIKVPLRKYEGEFRQFIATAVGRYCGCRPESLDLKMPVRQWEFMNESDGSWGVDPDEYSHFLKAFYEEIKAVDPGAKVVTAGLTSPGVLLSGFGAKVRYDYLERILASKELQGPHYPYFDVLNFHNYPALYGPTPNVFAINAAVGYIRKTLKAYNLEREIWLTEIGENSTNSSPMLQADRVVKFVLHAASLDIRRVYVFGLWDYTFGKSLEGWGLLEDTPSGEVPVRKPSFFAYQALLRKIAANMGVDFLGPGRYRISLTNGEKVYVFWREGPNQSPPAFLQGKVRVTDLQGKTRLLNVSQLKLTNHPLIVEGGNPSGSVGQ